MVARAIPVVSLVDLAHFAAFQWAKYEKDGRKVELKPVLPAIQSHRAEAPSDLLPAGRERRISGAMRCNGTT
jgi:hypothetical protein